MGGADRAYRRAIALNPSNDRARSQYARYLAAASRSAEALTEARRGVELEPGSASAVSTRAMIEDYARDNAKALQSANYAIQLEPASGSHYFVRGRVLSTSGDLAGAIQSLERAIELVGEGTPTSWRTHLLRLRALAGDRARAASDLEQLIADLAARRQSIGAAHIAYVRMRSAIRDQAIALLNHAVSERDPDVLWLNVDPRVDGLRSDSRFIDLLARIGIPKIARPRLTPPSAALTLPSFPFERSVEWPRNADLPGRPGKLRPRAGPPSGRRRRESARVRSRLGQPPRRCPRV